MLNYLGYIWVDRGENLLEGLDMIQRALQQRPDSAYIIDSLGWAYFKLGQYQQAIDALEQAAEASPTHPEVLEHLGDALWRAGRELEGIYQWNHALVFAIDDDVIQRLTDKIDNGLPALDEGAAPGLMNIQ